MREVWSCFGFKSGICLLTAPVPVHCFSIVFSNDFLKFIYQKSIKFWITNTLLHDFFQTDMIFFDQFKVSTIKFGKCFAEFMIPIALLQNFSS